MTTRARSRPQLERPKPEGHDMSTDYARIGRAMSDARRAAGLSQHDLAAVSGLTRSSIANCEAGRQRIPAGKLALIAAKLGTTVSQMLGESPVPESRIPTTLAARITGTQREITGLLADAAKVLAELTATSERYAGLLDQLAQEALGYDLALVAREERA